MTPRAELLALHKDALGRLERKLAPFVRESPTLRRYGGAYERELEGRFAVSTPEDLARAASAARVTYVGDYHTLAAAQRTFVDLLERVRERVGAVAIALETFEPRDRS